MKYISKRRAKFNAICGEVNLPYGTEVICEAGMLHVNMKPLCGDHSQNAYDFFARNDDGNGLLRGKLVDGIRKTLEKRDMNHQARWDKVWADPVCQKYKRADHADFWLWNHEFFNANIPDLQHIAALVGVKGGA